MNAALFVLIIRVASVCSRQWKDSVTGSESQLFLIKSIISFINSMKSKEEVEAPWLSIENSVEYLPLTFRIHDVLVYTVFKTCNILEPMPYLISFLNNVYLETLSNAFSMSKHPTMIFSGVLLILSII